MKRILVLCTANACRSQMAEGYLRFFAGRHAEIFSACLQTSEIDPLTRRVMLEDNIDLPNVAPRRLSALRQQAFDYLIIISDEAGTNGFSLPEAGTVVHISMVDPDRATGTDNERLAAFRHCRERVKHEMLHFIGKYLIPEQAPLPTW